MRATVSHSFLPKRLLRPMTQTYPHTTKHRLYIQTIRVLRLFNWVQTHVCTGFIFLFSISLFTDSNLLASSCTGLIALALGSDVYLWNSETQSLEGHVHPAQGPAPHSLPGRAGRPRQPVSSLCWSADGRLLSIGTRQGLIKVRSFRTSKHFYKPCSKRGLHIYSVFFLFSSLLQLEYAQSSSVAGYVRGWLVN